jgi:hypothetical protein
MPVLTRWSPPLAPILFALTCGCSEPATDELTGAWITAIRDLNPAGYDQSELRFGSGGGFRLEVRSYGLYPAQRKDELSAYVRIEGRFEIRNDRLIMSPKRSVTWDRFYGTDSPEVVQEPYDVPLFDQARFTVAGNRLRLNYLSYPFDAPVATEQEFVRAVPTM